MDRIAAALGIDLADPKSQAYLAMHRDRHQVIDRLVRIRKERNMTQQDVATELGVSRVAVSRIEREDRDPRLSTLMRYAEAVDAVLLLDAKPVEESQVYKGLATERKFAKVVSKPVSDTWKVTDFVDKDEPRKQNSDDFVKAA